MLFGLQILTVFAIVYASSDTEEVQHVLRHLQKYDKLESQLSYNVLRQIYGPNLEPHLVNSTGTGCKCIGYNCGCCLYIKVKEIDLDDTVCANFTYLVKDYGISFTVTIDKTTIINETISARNPPPICVDVPKLKQVASLCLEFKDLDITDKQFSGCVYLEARLAKVRIANIKLGCFKIPPKNQNEQALVTVN